MRQDMPARQVERLFRRGVPILLLAREFGRTRSGIRRALNAARARRLLGVRIRYVPHPDFEDPARHQEILGPTPATGDAPRRAEALRSLGPELACLCADPPLTPAQEVHLFRKMNFLKYRAFLLRRQIDPRRARTTDLDRLERLQDAAQRIKDALLGANFRLVVSLAGRIARRSRDCIELVPDGILALIEAVDGFDVAGGDPFRAYASHAIRMELVRALVRGKDRRRLRSLPGHDAGAVAAAGPRPDELAVVGRRGEGVGGGRAVARPA